MSKLVSTISALSKVLLPVFYAAAGALLGYWIKSTLDNRPGDVRCKVTSLARQRDSWVKLPTRDSMLGKKIGTRYVLRLAVVSLHRDFNARDCAVSMKYREAKEPFECVLYWLPRDIYDDPNGLKKALVYPLAQNILALTAMERGKPYDCYATFLVENPPQLTAQTLQRPVDFEWLKLRFTSFSGRPTTVTIRDATIDPSRVLFDPTIWRDATPEEVDFASHD